MNALRLASRLTFASKAKQVRIGQHGICAVLVEATAMSRSAHFFSCSNSRVLLGGIANDYFAIKMPGSVGENWYNEGETDEERQRANQ